MSLKESAKTAASQSAGRKQAGPRGGGDAPGGRSSGDAARFSVASMQKGDRLDKVVLLVETSNFKQTRDGKYFLQLILRDRTGSVRAVRWEASQELYRSFGEGDFIRLSGRVEEFQQNPQVVVDELEKIDAESVSADDFLPVCPRDIDEMERELQEHVAALQDPHLRALITLFLEDQQVARDLRRCPAGKTLHHAYVGGLLEHILSLIGASKLLVRNYPRLNADVLVAAAFLHDIGKLRELSYTSSFSYSDRGQLVGHIGVGLVMIAEKIELLEDFPAELHTHLEHIIASHHGLPEHGALKSPMTPEAIAFHFLDNLDAKMAMLDDMENALPAAGESATGRWTEYKPTLGKRIYFPS